MRLFVALDLPDATRDLIRELISQLKPIGRDARWVRPEGIHVTLKFIGEVERERIEPIAAALGAVRSQAPVDMRFRSVGFFPSDRRPRVFWCGIDASPNLAEIAAGVERALVPLGIAAEKRAFVPHLTLARFDTPRGLGALIERARELESLDLGSARDSAFHLYESVLQRSGAEYTKLQSFPFVRETA